MEQNLVSGSKPKTSSRCQLGVILSPHRQHPTPSPPREHIAMSQLGGGAIGASGQSQGCLKTSRTSQDRNPGVGSYSSFLPGGQWHVSGTAFPALPHAPSSPPAHRSSPFAVRTPHCSHAHLSLLVCFDLPAPGQFQPSVRKHVDEIHQVSVVLVAFKVARVPPDFEDHVLQAGATGEDSVGTLRGGRGPMGKAVGIRRNTDQAYFEHLNGMRCDCYTGIYCEPWALGVVCGARKWSSCSRSKRLPPVNTHGPPRGLALPLLQHPGRCRPALHLRAPLLLPPSSHPSRALLSQVSL